MKKYKNKLNTKLPLNAIEDEDKVDVHSMEVVVERVQGGLVGSLRIEDDINKPLFKKGDYVLLRAPARLAIKDFVLYESHEEYFLRRIIKYKEDDIYVAGDNERAYHIIHKEDIIGKVLSRERKNKRLSFSLTPKKKLYTFKKVNLAPLRLKNRILDYEQESNIESLELASQSIETKNLFENKAEIKYNIDLDSELKSFLDPDTLVLEYQNSLKQAPIEEVTQEEDVEQGEQVEYIEEVINENSEVEVIEPNTDEELEEAKENDDDEEVVYVDEDGNPIDIDENVEYIEEVEEVLEDSNEDDTQTSAVDTSE